VYTASGVLIGHGEVGAGESLPGRSWLLAVEVVADCLRIAVPAETSCYSEFLCLGFDCVRIVPEAFDYFVDGQFGLHVRNYVYSRLLLASIKCVNTYKCHRLNPRN
jgi:hypothetical protein